MVDFGEKMSSKMDENWGYPHDLGNPKIWLFKFGHELEMGFFSA
jgi:hypothetical protein